MPTYRFVGSDDMKPHIVLAERWQQIGSNVAFFNVALFDERLATAADPISVTVIGDVEVIA